MSAPSPSFDPIKSSIDAGSVYYYHEESWETSKEHYFVVINIDPTKDDVIYLVCSRSNIEKIRNIRKDCPETLVEISPAQYPEFKTKSIFDCNEVNSRKTSEISKKHSNGKLTIKPKLDIRIVGKLRDAVIASRLVADDIKKKLSSTKKETKQH